MLRPLALALLAAHVAAAQPLAERAGVALEAEPAPPGLAAGSDLEAGPRLSPGGAVALSLGATVGTMALGVVASELGSDAVAGALFAGGLLVGPSVGNLVQGEVRDAAVGTGLRVLGAGMMVGALGTVLFVDDVTGAESSAAAAAAVGGTVVLMVGLGHDLRTAHANAGRVSVRPRGAGLALEVGL